MSTLLPRLHTRTRSIVLVPFSIIIIKDVKPERARALCFKMTASTLHSKHCSHTIKTAEGKPLHCAPHCSKAQSDPQRKKQCNKFKNSKDCVGLTFPRKGYPRFWCPVQLHLGSGVWEYLPGSLHCTALHCTCGFLQQLLPEGARGTQEKVPEPSGEPNLPSPSGGQFTHLFDNRLGLPLLSI